MMRKKESDKDEMKNGSSAGIANANASTSSGLEEKKSPSPNDKGNESIV